MSETTTRKPLTNKTWADFPNGVRHGELIHWDAQADLEHELHARIPELSLDTCRALVGSAASGLPVTVTWDHTFDRECGLIGRTTATMVIECMFPRYMHVRYCGFGHPIYLTNIRDAVIPPTCRVIIDRETGRVVS